jgi:glutamine amidotransferase PdxT
VLARQGEDPIMVTDGRHLVTTFHPELTEQPQLHQHFLNHLAAAK